MANKMSSENFVDSLVDYFVTDSDVASAKGENLPSGSNQISLKKELRPGQIPHLLPRAHQIKMSFPLL
jgi:hypothetical protein